jgi:5-methylcytosine-specific restriction endonuclease McrA
MDGIRPKYLGTQRWKDVRKAVLSRDQRTCAYCGNENANTVDHVVPLVVGGDPYNMDGLVAACKRCNSAKGSKPVGVFLSANSTPPVFIDISLSKRDKSDISPFERP